MDSSETLTFLTTLFYPLPENVFILIWTLPDKRSAWFVSLEEATRYVDAVKYTKDVYVQMSVSREMFASNKRCPASKSAGIGCLWCEIDIADGYRKGKKSLFKSQEEALNFIRGIEMQPTMVVFSGGGYHCYWCFKEVWIFDTDQERSQAALLELRLQETIRHQLGKLGYELDSVGDLARVMRVAGSVNRKVETNPRDCVIEYNTEIRYEPSDLENYLVTEVSEADQIAQGIKERKVIDTTPGIYVFTLNPDAEPPAEKWEALQLIEPRAKLSYEHNRKDFTRDSSASAYDQSLASFAAGVDWSDQEIVDLLIASRRYNKCDLKLNRPDYFKSTILTARKGKKYDEALEEVEVAEVDKGAMADSAAPNGPNIADILETLLGFRIERVIKYTASEPLFRLETNKGSISLGDVSNLIGQTQFRKKVAALTGIFLPLKSPAKWARIAQLLLDLCEIESIGDENTEMGKIEDWLMDYFEQWVPTDVPDIDERKNDLLIDALRLKAPFIRGAYVYIILSAFREWVMRARNDLSVVSEHIGTSLRAMGWEPYTLNVVVEGRPSTRGTWRCKHERYPWMPRQEAYVSSEKWN